MKIGLFIPCFMNELYPDICKATYKLLKNQGLNIDYPLNQTCCGQPMANSGCAKDVKVLAIILLIISKIMIILLHLVVHVLLW